MKLLFMKKNQDGEYVPSPGKVVLVGLFILITSPFVISSLFTL